MKLVKKLSFVADFVAKGVSLNVAPSLKDIGDMMFQLA